MTTDSAYPRPTSSERQPYNLDVLQMEVDAGGVKNFFWPLSYREKYQFGWDLSVAYMDLVRRYDESDGIMLPYKLMGKYFLNEAVSIYTGSVVHSRFLAAGYEPLVPDRYYRWQALYEEKAPPPLPVLAALKRIADHKQSVSQKFSLARIKRLLKKIKLRAGTMQIDGFKVKPINAAVLKNEIIATQRFPLMLDHMKQIDEEAVFCRSDKWFSPVSDEEIKSSKNNAHVEFEKALVEALDNVFAQYKTDLESYSRDYLIHLVREGAALLRVHYERLCKVPERLPHRVWTGSTGSTWDTILRAAVIAQGGYAVGHDHGGGSAHVDYPYSGLDEFWACNEYMTFNENNAAETKRLMTSWLSFDRVMPKVTGINTGKAPRSMRIMPSHVGKKNVKTVMVMVSFFDGDRGRRTYYSPDITLMDWQVRLFRKLKEWGYDIIAKVHPDSPIMPPVFYQEELGVKVTSEIFEDVVQDADVVIFDYILTTTFRSVLETNVPFVITDFYDHPFTEKAHEMLLKRCEFINAGFDERNRRQVDWDRLKGAIENAPKKNDNHEFFNFYYA